MATYIHRVLPNTRWRIESLTPTCVFGSPALKFRSFDPSRFEPDNTSGAIRLFFAHWIGSDQDGGATNLDARESAHTIQVHVTYPPASMPFDDLEIMILQDRHDIIKTMRDPAHLVGVSDAQPTAETGLMLRRRLQPDRLMAGGSLIPGMYDLDPSILQLQFELHCEVREEE